MAYTNTPTISTYRSERIPLIRDLELASTSVSLSFAYGLANVLPFKTEGKNADLGEDALVGEGRDAITMTADLSSATNLDVCRGMYVWEKSIGTIYYFVVKSDGTNSFVYSSTDGITFTSVNTLGTNATTPCRFTEFIDATNTKKLVLVTGDEGYVFTSNAAGTKIVDADFPTPHVPWPVFLDGYLFLAKAGTGDIYNSDLNDPSAWTAGSFISSEMYPDDVQALVKVNNYLLAIGMYGSEFFYDAANATASPLARYEGGALPFGTKFPNSIAFTNDVVILLANDLAGGTTFKIIDGLKHSDIPALAVLKSLSHLLATGEVTAVGVRGSFFRQNGKLFYLFATNGNVATAPASGFSVAFSPETKIWARMITNTGVGRLYPVFFTAPGTSTNTTTFVASSWQGCVSFGYTDPNSLTDSARWGALIQQTIRIPPQTFGTMNRKFLSRLSVMYDGLDNAVANNPTIFVTPDFTNAGAGRQPLGTWGAGYPFITQLGSFRVVQIEIQHTAYKARWWFVECDINKGQR